MTFDYWFATLRDRRLNTPRYRIVGVQAFHVQAAQQQRKYWSREQEASSLLGYRLLFGMLYPSLGI
jgi:hypothetical protein